MTKRSINSPGRLGIRSNSFLFDDDPEALDTSAGLSFRALTKMTARDRDAALAAASLGLQVSDWLETNFSLPAPELLDLSYETDAGAAAYSLRQFWGWVNDPSQIC